MSSSSPPNSGKPQSHKRTAIACLECRRRKVKCETPGENQACRRCIDGQVASECRYEPVTSPGPGVQGFTFAPQYPADTSHSPVMAPYPSPPHSTPHPPIQRPPIFPDPNSIMIDPALVPPYQHPGQYGPLYPQSTYPTPGHPHHQGQYGIGPSNNNAVYPPPMGNPPYPNIPQGWQMPGPQGQSSYMSAPPGLGPNVGYPGPSQGHSPPGPVYYPPTGPSGGAHPMNPSMGNPYNYTPNPKDRR